MKVVETTIRPTRMAFLVSRDASARVVRRTFKLLGGRWGGRQDLLVSVDPGEPPNEFFSDILRLADPDMIFMVDPKLRDYPADEYVRELGIQPFSVARLKERQEHESLMSLLFVERPFVPKEAGTDGKVVDLGSGTNWRQAASCGLPHPDSRGERTARTDGEVNDWPVVRGDFGLVRIGAASRWVLLGDDDNDIDMASRFWSLRAVGCQVAWFSNARLERERLIPGARKTNLYAPTASQSALEAALGRWNRDARQVSLAPARPSDVIERPGLHYLSTKAEALVPHRGAFWPSVPTPPQMGEALDPRIFVVAEYRTSSPTPEDPDGTILVACNESRRLVTRGSSALTRVTRGGTARLIRFTRSGVIEIPDIRHDDAVAAPFVDAGYRLEPSDKGLYQQRSLQIAGGLRYLAWLLRQTQSKHLLDLFFQNHRAGKAPAHYRRVVTYADLETHLEAELRTRRARISRALATEAREWLRAWADSLIERGLLVAGHVLKCPKCADRSFYRLEHVGQTFSCRRCDAAIPMPAQSERGFQLNEAFYQLVQHHGDVGVLLLALLRDDAKRSLLYVSEVVAVPAVGRPRELDVAALVDGDLLIAEVKSNDRLSTKEVQGSLEVARRTGAKRIAFATTARTQPLCRELDCQRCARDHGVNHRDRAWGDGARALIEAARVDLASRGKSLEVHCFESLVGAHNDFRSELGRFKLPSADSYV